jgi:hypothetical protein
MALDWSLVTARMHSESLIFTEQEILLTRTSDVLAEERGRKFCKYHDIIIGIENRLIYAIQW